MNSSNYHSEVAKITNGQKNGSAKGEYKEVPLHGLIT